MKLTTVFAAGFCMPLSVTLVRSTVNVQASPATSAVPVLMVKLVPLMAWLSEMPLLVLQLRSKAPAVSVTGSLNITTMSPADGKLLSPSIGVVDRTAGGASATGTKAMLPGSTSVSADPSWSVTALVLNVSVQFSPAMKSLAGSRL